MLIQGRLYLTENHVAFRSFKTNFILDWTQIVSIERKSLALVIPNAIQLETGSQKFFLASFFSRDEVFEKMIRLWSNHVPPESLYRKYPDIQGLSCGCSALLEDDNDLDSLNDKILRSSPLKRSPKTNGLNRKRCDVCLAAARLLARQETLDRNGSNLSVASAPLELTGSKNYGGPRRAVTVAVTRPQKSSSLSKSFEPPSATSSLGTQPATTNHNRRPSTTVSDLSSKSNPVNIKKSSSPSKQGLEPKGSPPQSQPSRMSIINGSPLANSVTTLSDDEQGDSEKIYSNLRNEKTPYEEDDDNLSPFDEELPLDSSALPKTILDLPPPQCDCEMLEGSKLMFDFTVPIPLNKVYHKLLLVEPTEEGGWYLGYFKKQGVTEMKMGPWVSKAESSITLPLDEVIVNPQKLEITQCKAGDHRSFECLMPLTATIGPKSVQCFIRHEISSMLPGTSLCIYMKTETPYAPYGTSFHTDGRLCLTSGEGGLSTRIVHHYRVVFTKSTILKGPITKNALASTDKFYSEFETYIRDRLHLPSPKQRETIQSPHKLKHSPHRSPHRHLTKQDSKHTSSRHAKKEVGPVFTTVQTPSLTGGGFRLWWTLAWVGVLVLICLQSFVLIKLVGVIEVLERRLVRA